MSGGSLLTGLLPGKLPGKSWSDNLMFYVELSDKSMHIYEDFNDPRKPRRHFRTLEVNSSDSTGKDGKDKKKDFKFFYERSDGKYLFKCASAEQRQDWMTNLQRLIQRKEYMEKGLLSESEDIFSPPVSSPSGLQKFNVPRPPPRATTLLPSHTLNTVTPPPPPPPHKRDSGFISGTGEVTRSYLRGSMSGDGTIMHVKSNSGDSAIVHNTCVITNNFSVTSHSAEGTFTHRTNTAPSNPVISLEEEDDLSRYEWYWGEMNRDECKEALTRRAQIGNFVVRKSKGNFVMSFWRKDGIHHHIIIRNGNTFQFERSVVQATGENIPDLLDTYMKHCSDKSIGPYGGQLYPNYDEAWNPPEIDFTKFQDQLKKMKGNTNKRMFKAGCGLEDHTYGGLKLSEMKKVLDREVCTDAVNSSLVQGGTPTPFAGFQPNQRNSMQFVPDPTKISNKSLSPKPKKTNPSMVSVLPETQKQLPQLPTGYVNMFPSPSRYENAHLSKNEEEEDEDEDGDQEIYVEPGTLEDDDVTEESDSNVYQNYNFGKTEPQKNYVNMSELQNNPPPAPSPSHDASIYANVTYQGKPLTPPRVKPKVKPRPRQY